MNTTATFVERRKMRDRRSMKNRSQDEQISQPMKHGLLFKFLSTLLVICAGLIAYRALGINNAMDSTTGKIALGVGISLYFLVCFRHALYRYGQ